MPRRAANPDPAVEEYRSTFDVTFRIEAYRDGSYRLYRGGQQAHVGMSPIGHGFGSPKWPSNRLQAEAMAAAKGRIELFMKP